MPILGAILVIIAAMLFYEGHHLYLQQPLVKEKGHYWLKVHNSFRKVVAVFSWPGFRRVIKLYNSIRLFSTGVAVSKSKNRFFKELTSFQLRVFRFFR